METTLVGLLAIVVGVFCVVCAAMDAEFFMNSRKARLPVAIMGRTGARIFYVILGLTFVVVGIGFSTGLIPAHASGA